MGRPGYLLGGGGSTAPNQLFAGKTLYVDATGGNDTLGALGVYDRFLPWATITAAVAAMSTGDTVRVGHGVYAENFTIPDGCLVVGEPQEGVLGAVIAGSGATSDRVTLGAGSGLRNFVIHPPGTSGAGVLLTGAGSGASNITIVGQGAGGRGIVNNSSGSVGITNIVQLGGALDHLIYSNAGIVLLIDIFALFGSANSVIENAGTGNINGWHVGVNEGYTSTNALLVSAAGSLQLLNSALRGQTNGLHVTANGATIDLNNVNFTGSTWDVLVDSGLTSLARFKITSSDVASAKISIPAAVMAQETTFITASDTTPGDVGSIVIGQFSVGHYLRGSESVFGEGDSHVNDMVVLSNTNAEAGSWVDHTTDAQSSAASTFATFPGTTANNTLYIGGDVEFPSVKLDVDTAMTIGSGVIVWEYWDSASWVEFYIMTTQAMAPYTQKAQRFARDAESQQLRLQDRAGDTKKTLDGNNKYWIRARITTAITGAGLLQQVKLGTNRSEINSDGHQERFGGGQSPRLINTWEPQFGVEISGATIGDESLDLNTGFILLTTNNKFANAQQDDISFKIRIIHGVDTSKAFTVRSRWYPDSTNTGSCDIEWDHGTIAVGTVLDGTVPITNETQSITPGGVASAVQEFDHTEYFPDAEEGDVVWIKLSRPTGDAFTGNMILVDTYCENRAWS